MYLLKIEYICVINNSVMFIIAYLFNDMNQLILHIINKNNDTQFGYFVLICLVNQ